MPTAAKLAAFLAFALIGAAATETYKALLPEGARLGMFTPVNAAICAVCGWAIAGRLVGRGYGAAAGSGLRAAFAALFHVLVIWSAYTMVRRATQMRYDDTFEALQGMLVLAADYVVLGLGDPRVPLILFGGAVLAGWLAEWTARRFA